MVKLISIIFFNHLGHGNEPAMIASAYELSRYLFFYFLMSFCLKLFSFGFFYESGAREISTFASRELVKRCNKGQTESVVHLGYHGIEIYFHFKIQAISSC